MKPSKKPIFLLCIFCLLFVLAAVISSCAQQIKMAVPAKVIVTTRAGTGEKGYKDGPASDATFVNPQGVAAAEDGNIFVSDLGNGQIRKITPGGNVETIASIPWGSNAMVFNSKGELVICASQNIYRLTKQNELQRLAGAIGLYADGSANSASFYNAGAIAVDKDDNIYIADYGNNLIRKLANDSVNTVGATPGIKVDPYGKVTPPHFDFPSGVAADSKGNIYVVECYKNHILKISPGNVVTLFAGSGDADSTDGMGKAASFNFPHNLAVDRHDNLYLADQGNNKIRMITPDGLVTTLAGNGDYASDDGDGLSASFNGPTAIATGKDGEVYVAEIDGQKIRKITFNYEDYLQSRREYIKVNDHHTIANADTGVADIQIDTADYKLPYKDTTMEVYGPDYIDTFSVGGVQFRFVHINDRRKRNNVATLERLTGGKWIKGITFMPMNHQGDFSHSMDVNNDGFIDITHELRFTSEVYFFDPVEKDFLPASDDQLNGDITLIDRKRNIFCDFQAFKGMCGQITSNLYTYNGFKQKVLFTMHFVNCEAERYAYDITSISIRHPKGNVVKVIKLKSPFDAFDIDKGFDYKGYWKKNYKRLLGYK